MSQQINPILPGFHPDPSIVRVGDDYYIAVSTFEWYPGVQIFHSVDLVNWTLVSRPLNRAALLDMTGCPDSCGIWAPCLSYAEGLFYLIYTNVKRFDGNFKDTPNYLTTCSTIDGEWSNPVYLNSSGFDPSLFHDDDGSKWLVNMLWDHRPNKHPFAGIVLQQYCHKQQKLIGTAVNIFAGSPHRLTEGPHLYKINDYYYLLTAEGGTSYEHACTFARSKHIAGPYEIDPNVHVLTSKDQLDKPLQRTGHGGLVQTQEGQWYLTHLLSRPLKLDDGVKRSPLGRETGIQALILHDDAWFRLASGEVYGEVNPIGLTVTPKRDFSHYDDFSTSILPCHYQWLRIPNPECFYSLTDKPGALTLYGKHSVGSTFKQALIARRQQHLSFVAQTQLRFKPMSFQQQAGLICYYNAHKFHYLYVSYDDEKGVHIDVMSCLGDESLKADFPIYQKRLPISSETVSLRAEVDNELLTFSYSVEKDVWLPICELDYSVISDEAGKGEGANFTGAFIGMCCQDLTGANIAAEFNYFDYQEKH
ncbi:glycoside hydrolase family 43 protein [Shewanella sp. 6_MG-2023]|uniref:glycoside hydrolase family 43 protein n=1 Tax=Shewanella sp. 6_MG-2023 TaxID=3062660 RepID=UPI0026E29A2F|nr:glycoside hydrolase family 43 protein [Shewanella sp. 6_MG-2023]MDO6618331.1 glycoside hydrolase family 43 protein [Shewanella sp. 6_MG-2023]